LHVKFLTFFFGISKMWANGGLTANEKPARDSK
jgi:hypothetical protein